MVAGPGNVLETDVYNGEGGHAAKHNAVNDQVNYLTEEVAGRLSESEITASIAGLAAPKNTSSPTLPAGLGWNADSKYALTPSLVDAFGPVGAVGSVGATPEAIFGRFTNMLTNPDLTLYVDRAAANDTMDGSSWATPIQSLSRLATLANANGGKVLAYVKAGIYERSRSLAAVATAITCDLALVAVGGRVVTGTFDVFTSATPDGTYPGCYTVTVANCDRVMDIATPNRFGNHTDLVQVASAAACNVTPGSWFLTGSTLYLHRADGAAITTTNTRVYRNQTANLLVETPKHLYVGGLGLGYGFDFEGGAGSAVAYVTMKSLAPTADPKAAVFVNTTAKYGGGAIGTATIGFGVSGWNGLAAFFNCQADANASDGFNSHNAQGAPIPQSVTVNCSGQDNGRGTTTSVQGLTLHEDVKHVDVAGYFQRNRGGNIRNINTSKLFALGTLAKDDLGDIRVGGAMPPTGVRLDDTAEGWFERVKIDQPRGQAAWATGSAGSTIRRRNCLGVPQEDTGPGVFATS